MKQTFILFFITTIFFTSIFHATHIMFINDSIFTLFISDHATFGSLLSPQAHYAFNSNELATLYLYTQHNTEDHAFRLSYRVQEQQLSIEPVTMAYQDIVSKRLEQSYPNQFSVTHQTKLFFERQQEQREQQRKSYDREATERQKSQQSNHSQSTRSGHPAHAHHQSGQPQAVLDSIIAQYQKMQNNNFGGDSFSDMFAPPSMQFSGAPKRSPRK